MLFQAIRTGSHRPEERAATGLRAAEALLAEDEPAKARILLTDLVAEVRTQEQLHATLLALARAERADSRPVRAALILKRLVDETPATWPRLHEARLELARAYADLGAVRAAAKVLLTTPERDETAALRIAIGRLALANGLPELARRLAAGVVHDDKPDPSAHMLIARSRLMEGERQRAAAIAESVYETVKDRPEQRPLATEALSLLGDVHRADGRAADAARCYSGPPETWLETAEEGKEEGKDDGKELEKEEKSDA
jgi:hypothetical protein